MRRTAPVAGVPSAAAGDPRAKAPTPGAAGDRSSGRPSGASASGPARSTARSTSRVRRGRQLLRARRRQQPRPDVRQFLELHARLREPTGSRDGEFNNPAAIAIDPDRGGLPHLRRRHRQPPGSDLQLESTDGPVEFFDTCGRPAAAAMAIFGSRRDIVLDGDGFKSPRDITFDAEDEQLRPRQRATSGCRSFDPNRSRFLGEWGRPFGSRGGSFDRPGVDRLVRRSASATSTCSARGCLVQQFQLGRDAGEQLAGRRPGVRALRRRRGSRSTTRTTTSTFSTPATACFERFNLGRALPRCAARGASGRSPNRSGSAVNPDRDEFAGRRHGEQHRAEVHPALTVVGARGADGSDHAQGGTMSKRFRIAAAVLGAVLGAVCAAPPRGAGAGLHARYR